MTETLEQEEATKEFHFWNGDKYSGTFACLKDKQKLVMEGYGIYKTANGDTYEGNWENDSLCEAKKIVYADRTEFSGTLKDMIMEGPGQYRFKENVEIEGTLTDNCFTDNIRLRDPEGHIWKTHQPHENDFAIFSPCHSFWQFVLNLPLQNGYFYDGGENEEEEQDGGESIW